MTMRLIFAILLCAVPVSAQSVHYRIRMPDPETHLYHVEMTIEDIGLVHSIWAFQPGTRLTSSATSPSTFRSSR